MCIRDRIITVCGDTVLRTDRQQIETIIGTVVDDGEPVAFSSSQTETVLVSGGRVYLVLLDEVIDFTDNIASAGASGDIIDVAVINSQHLYLEENSGRVFFSEPGDARTVTQFFTAEENPDNGRALLVVNSSILVLGSNTTELFTSTTSDITPFIRRNGNTLQVGVTNSKSRYELQGIAYWVGEDDVIYRWSGGREEIISPTWMNRALARLNEEARAAIYMNVHTWYEHRFMSVFIPGAGDYFYDQVTGAWHRRKSNSDALDAQ